MSWFSKTFKKIVKPVKKLVSGVGKGVGTILGMGSSSSPKVEEVKTEPPVTPVTDVSGDTKSAENAQDVKKKRRKGFASTSVSTILGGSKDGDTLG